MITNNVGRNLYSGWQLDETDFRVLKTNGAFENYRTDLYREKISKELEQQTELVKETIESDERRKSTRRLESMQDPPENV